MLETIIYEWSWNMTTSRSGGKCDESRVSDEVCTRLQQVVEAEPHGIRKQLQHVPGLQHQSRVGRHQHHGRQQEAVDHILNLALHPQDRDFIQLITETINHETQLQHAVTVNGAAK